MDETEADVRASLCTMICAGIPSDLLQAILKQTEGDDVGRLRHLSQAADHAALRACLVVNRS